MNMKCNLKALHILSIFFILTTSCRDNSVVESNNIKIAFIADIHLLDIYGEFTDTDYKGVKNPKTEKYNTIRTMKAQLHSTRLFNENYFAFIAALEDVVKRGIKLVALPGDFSDDGQPLNIRALRRIIDAYSIKHGIQFFAITGNHDPAKPFSKDAGKFDFLGEGGKQLAIVSSNKLIKSESKSELSPIITADIKEWGYKDILNELTDFGFFPRRDYRYWETPFSNYTYENYTLEKATENAKLENRTYEISNHKLQVPDISYLVEPVDGIWLLAIDGNVYVPKEKVSGEKNNSNDFGGASIGYNNVLKHKKYLFEWVKKVAEEAEIRGKTLIAFSHYPMVDFNDGASSEMKELFGAGKMQLHRVPEYLVAELFADAGVQIHFGGHMHINDTGVSTSKKGNTLFNIQTPSLAAYIPGYKILSVKPNKMLEVETVVLDDVPNFNELFPLYEKEYQHLKEVGDDDIWNRDILKSKTYNEFTQWHLKELVRLRFLLEDWPKGFTEKLTTSKGSDLLLTANRGVYSAQIKSILIENQLNLEDFNEWNGFDMIYDFYRLRGADELAIPIIGLKRLQQYSLVCEQLKQTGNTPFKLWAKIFEKASKGQPANHFRIDLNTNSIDRIYP
jgi:3',5'-cyclic AMP phosphodiesterase CpdA